MQAIEWEHFVEQNYQAIFRFCMHILRNSADAEDAVQKTFLKAYLKKDSLNDNSKLKSWIYSIARNVCIDKQRWWKRNRTEPEEYGTDANSESSNPELTMTLQALIAQLPTKQREVFILRHWHGFSTKQVAEILKIKEGTVKSHLKRGVEKIKEGLLKADVLETTTNSITTSDLKNGEEKHEFEREKNRPGL